VQLQTPQEDVFDAGVSIPGEEHECEHDKLSPRQRPRRTALLIGHGDFMSLVLKRVVAGYGHWVENEGIPHRSAFVHFNTGITELEYFGKGRFLLMSSNQTPHIHPNEYSALRTGGGLKDGWAYLMPDAQILLNTEVSVAFLDEMDDHVREQTEALKALYLSSEKSQQLHPNKNFLVEEEATRTRRDKASSDVDGSSSSLLSKPDNIHFVVQHGLQVVGVATYSESTGQVFDVAVRPSAGETTVAETLLDAVKEHARKSGRSGSLLVRPRSMESMKMFQGLGFQEKDDVGPDVDADKLEMELKP